MSTFAQRARGRTPIPDDKLDHQPSCLESLCPCFFRPSSPAKPTSADPGSGKTSTSGEQQIGASKPENNYTNGGGYVDNQTSNGSLTEKKMLDPAKENFSRPEVDHGRSKEKPKIVVKEESSYVSRPEVDHGRSKEKPKIVVKEESSYVSRPEVDHGWSKEKPKIVVKEESSYLRSKDQRLNPPEMIGSSSSHEADQPLLREQQKVSPPRKNVNGSETGQVVLKEQKKIYHPRKNGSPEAASDTLAKERQKGQNSENIVSSFEALLKEKQKVYPPTKNISSMEAEEQATGRSL